MRHPQAAGTILWLAAVGLAAVGLSAQAVPPAQAAAAAAGAKAQPVVVTQLDTHARFESDGTGWRESTAAIEVRTAAAVQSLGVLAFPYISGHEAVTVAYARVRKPDGSVVVTPPENIRDLPDQVSRVAPVYSDGMVKQVLIKGLEAGDTLEYRVRTQLVKPDVPGQFSFAWNFQRAELVNREDLTLDVPADMYVHVVSPGNKPEISDQDGRRIYHWQTATTALPALDSQQEPQPPAVQATTYHSWQEVESWAAGLMAPAAALTPAVRAQAAAITQGVSGDEARIAALYAWVAGHIHYVSISIGPGRYQPHRADAVLANGYGDCKDQATLLVALLRAAGFTADPVLVNASSPVSADVPSPSQFDHMITRVQTAAGPLWLDTTTAVAPPGWLAPDLRGRDGLVLGGSDAARLVQPPPNLPYPSRESYGFTGTLSADGTLTGHVVVEARDDSEVLIRAGFANVPQAQWNEFVQQLARLEGFGGTVSTVMAAAPDDTAKPYEYSYNYTRPTYSDWAEHAITPPVPALLLPDPDQPPAAGIRLGSATTSVDYSAAVTLAPGYAIAARAPVDLVNDFAEYHATYAFQGQTLSAERRLVIKMNRVPAGEFAAYKAFVKAMTEDESAWLSVTTPAGEAGAGTPVQQSRDLNDAGYKAYQAGDFTTAGQDYRKAVELDPKNDYAWNDLGLLEARQGKLQNAMADYNHAIANNPRQPYAYANLAMVQTMLRQYDDAEKNYRAQLQVAPNDQRSNDGLGSLLLMEKKYPEAVAQLKAAAALADSANLEYMLGEAELESGDPAGGGAALDKAVQMAPSPLTFNNVAYQLSVHGLELDKARQYAQSSVISLEGLLAGVDLPTVKTAQLANVALLADAWDTLGWVYYQQGNLALAENYVAAAWNLGEDAAMADHLGTIYEKEGKKAAAMALYAAADMPSGPPHARARLAALAGSENAADLFTAEHSGDASRARTVMLPRPPGVSGKAEAQFYLSFEPGPKVVAVQFLSGDARLRAAAAELQAAHYAIVFPAHESTRLIREGALSCDASAVLDAQGKPEPCTFVLFPAPNADRPQP